MKLHVFSADGASSVEKEFPIPSFEGDKGRQALKQVILAYLANRRQGTQSTKDQSTVHGTGKKPFRQKGTGRARQGTLRGAQHYHGAKAHGPHPRDWSQKISKNLRQLALRRALYERALDGEVVVIEKWELPERKTKLFNALVGKIAPEGQILVVDDSWADGTVLAGRNLNRIQLGEAREVNAYDLARYDRVILSEKGLERLLSRLSDNKGGQAA